ncbi:endonuclease/exonuclease/phosphatase family protein [Brevundimonas lutea]|uniref:endonuclease/exonuclease/phosphatase family protein n=1 Tax=Brevundimonas lutea TaxID=2293980 RepID=UPI000F030E1B|nr:endonuclease/exonuclease/phosphatase family protein [Brevundimonas lutea]
MLNRRRLLVAGAGIAAMPLAACATTGTSARRSLTVATFNIWHDMGDWPTRRPMVIRDLAALDADIIGLQEVLQDEGLPNQAEDIAQALGGYDVHFVSIDPPGQARRYGNAVLSRLPVLARDEMKLRPLDDSRTAAHVRVDLDGSPVDIFNTHLHWRQEGGAIRAQQIADLLNFIDSRSDDASSLVLGDMNAVIAWPEFQPLLARYDDAWRLRNPTAREPTTLVPGLHQSAVRIDHVLVEKDCFTVHDARLFATEADAAGVYPSDHFGVMARLAVR